MQARDRGQDSFKPVLEPGKGIGGINLGAPVHEVLAILQKHPDVFSNIEIKFCAQDICSMDLLIECPDIGMNIICGASEQRVRLIEFYRPREFAILYCDVACCGPKVIPSHASHSTRKGSNWSDYNILQFDLTRANIAI
jgi:hypothetical protein